LREWLGDLFYFTGDIEQAHREYVEAKRLDPKAPSVWARLAAVHLAEDDFLRAKTAVGEALRLLPDGVPQDPAALGRHFFEQRESAAAIAPLLLAVGADSTDWRSCRLLGFIAMEIQQDPEQAARFFDLALSSMPVGAQRTQLQSIRKQLQTPD
jgi:cytochrome c-type biogenesis protein CcmH/NrfG